MKLIFKILIFIALLCVGLFVFWDKAEAPVLQYTISASPSPTPITKAQLPVPFVVEAPGGSFTGNWKNACEEASFTMVEYYYKGRDSVSVAEAETFMTMLFEKQDEKYGDNINSDATQAKYLIDNFTGFKAEIIRNPTIEQIKKELDADRPVISFHYGFDLKNKNIPFLRTGTSYHALVIIGYDDYRKEFIVNDDGDEKTGKAHRYKYDLFMNSLHEYSYITKKADGPATVLFTSK